MAGDRLLGEFLRARRRITTPAQVGLPPMGGRAETFGIGGGLGQLLVIMQTRPDSHTERTLPLLDAGRPPLAAAVTTPSPPR